MCLSVTHRESIDSADLFPYGEYVEQGLGGVLPNPIPRVDHGLPTVSGGHLETEALKYHYNIVLWRPSTAEQSHYIILEIA